MAAQPESIAPSEAKHSGACETKVASCYPFYVWSLLISAILAVTALMWAVRSPPVPTFAGRSIDYWLGDRRLPESITNEPERKALDDFYTGGFRAMGTNVIPHLLSLQAAHDSKLQLWIYSLIRRQSWVRFTPPVNAHEKHQRATLGFILLKDDNKSAIPGIIKLARNDNEVSVDALHCLRNLHIPKDEWYSLLLYLYQKPDDHTQFWAARYLQFDFPDRAEALGANEKFPPVKVYPPEP